MKKYAAMLAILICTAGCGIFGSSDGESKKSAPAADPRDAERAEIRSRISAKKQELAQVDTDLSKINTERESLAGQPASETKTNRLVELARLESDLKLKKSSITDDIAADQQRLGEGSSSSSAAKTAKSDPLDDLLAANENKEKEEAARLKKKAEDDASADKARIAQADAARKAEEEERAKQKIEGGRLAQGADGPSFEERWADVIQKVRGELQRFKRW